MLLNTLGKIDFKLHTLSVLSVYSHRFVYNPNAFFTVICVIS